MTSPTADVVIVGAGAAGLSAAIFTKSLAPEAQVVLVDGATQPGAKILVSGGSRCNVTNTVVTERDFNGGSPATIRRILRAFTAADARAWFASMGVPLREEPGGKLFPDSNSSRDVLNALLRELDRVGVLRRFGDRVTDIVRAANGFVVRTERGDISSRAVVLATGGLSLPKTGSDGWGYGVAIRLGHTLVPTTPALVPLMLEASGPTPPHRALSGVAQPCRIRVRVDGHSVADITGALLWTHFGVSGPAVLDASRHWLRGRLEGRAADVTLSLRPGARFEAIEADWIRLARERPRTRIEAVLADLVPASVASALMGASAVDSQRIMAELTKDERRRLLHALLSLELPVSESRGYSYAEVTAGGVPLAEIDPASMTSRVCPGLYLVGEILDVDGRIGGFNFQWAWSTGRVAAQALTRSR